MRVVALETINRGKGLVIVRLLQVAIFRVVTIQAQRRGGFFKMTCKFSLAGIAHFVDGMAGITAHVQRSVAASFRWNVQSCGVAGQAEVFAFAT